MIVVIFEAFPGEEQRNQYLDLAAKLRSELSKIDGFISIERFQSINDPGKILSLSFWENEKSIMQWRNLELHRKAQIEGRKTIFDNYRLRVAAVTRDYSMTEREQAPNDSKTIHTN